MPSTNQGVLRLQVHLQPRAAHDRVVGRHGGAVKIQVRAAPVDGAANAALIKLLAGELRVPRSAVRIVRGTTGRNKLVEITTNDAAACERRLAQAQGPCVDKAEVAD